MNPAYSVILLTTLIGAGQGLFLALFASEVFLNLSQASAPGRVFYAGGSALSLVLMTCGLVASFFHLGHPERAWRAICMWRTSWLSREVIVLPIVMSLVGLYALASYQQPTFGGVAAPQWTLILGAVASVLIVVLFVCTGMIYACIKFLQEWASPLTVVNYTLLGLSSGFLLASAYAAFMFPGLTNWFGEWTAYITVVALLARASSLARNATLRPKSTLQSAIGVRHRKITQQTQGFMGGSFNTREFFHALAPRLLRSAKWVFLLLVFPLPLLLLALGVSWQMPELLVAAFVVQYVGLLVERWYFFADANHPQNLYYQSI